MKLAIIKIKREVIWKQRRFNRKAGMRPL